MQFRRVGGLTGVQIGVACFVGVLGGLYIWKPLLLRYKAENLETTDTNYRMSAYKTWAAKQRGNPILLIIAAAGFTGGLYISYRHFYAPWNNRRKLAAAESFAELLYEKELRAKDV